MAGHELQQGERCIMEHQIWHLTCGDGPVLATAIHHGHRLRPDVSQLLALSEQQRLHEEDPFTGSWATIVQTHFIVEHSRFEVDLNRPREKAVYRSPEDAWGLRVWKHHVPRELLQDSLAEYDCFYETIKKLLTEKTKTYGRCVVFDFHSYNHRRAGPHAASANPVLNPEVNIGTGTMNRQRWAPLVNRFLEDMRNFDYPSFDNPTAKRSVSGSAEQGGRRRHLDVRENVKFHGGYFPRWVHENFPDSVCVLAIEFKKFFMDEWTGEPFAQHMQAIRRCLKSTLPGIYEQLKKP